MIETIIEQQTKKLNLLKELKQSLIYEKCTYHLIKHDNCQPIQYQLFRISDKKSLVIGTPNKIESYLNLRKINKKLIYKTF